MALSPDMPRISRRRVGRPATSVLGKQAITDAALELVTREGYEQFTMASLARQLDVAPSALYNHVGAKRDVLLLVEDHLMSLVDVSDFGSSPWEDAVRRWAWSYRDVFAKHTPLIPVIAVLPVANAPQTLAMYETVSKALQDAGFPLKRIVPSIVAFESFIFGSAYDVGAPLDIFDAGTMKGTAPCFTSAVRSRLAAAAGQPSDSAFTLGLEALIDGVRPLQ